MGAKQLTSGLTCVLAVVTTLTSCSSNTNGGAGTPRSSTTPSLTGGAATAAGASTSTATSGGAADVDCPLTAAQVSSVVGVPMKLVAGICKFEPASGRLLPNAGYNKQNEMLVTDELAKQAGYPEKVSGIGDVAYLVRRADGTWVLSKVGSHAFEVRVDSANATADRAFTINLAKLVVSALS